jgi:hypothetical protein
MEAERASGRRISVVPTMGWPCQLEPDAPGQERLPTPGNSVRRVRCATVGADLMRGLYGAGEEGG